jgi:putative flippase GtrA
MIDAQTRRQFTRYVMVGAVSNSFLYLSYIGLTSIGWGHKTAMTLLYITGGLLTFIANRKWSFTHRGSGRSALARYIVAYVLGYLFNFALLWLFVDRLHQPHQIVQAVAIVLVAVSLFLMNKFWVFAPHAVRGGAG